MSTIQATGAITWVDLTVEDAARVRDFYQAVAGWTPRTVPMGEYADFTMQSGGIDVAGICHARGGNAELPPVWLIYVTVDDLDESLEACTRLGGTIVTPPRRYGGGRYCVIKDPAGAFCALYQAADAA